jgi:hypothetical protein
MSKASRRITILNPTLFWRKLALLSLTMAALVPLVINKLQVPAMVYVAALWVIHVWVFFLYIYRVNWRSFSKTGLLSRLGSVVIFSYLLSKVRYSGGTEVLWSIFAAFVLHVLILVILMVKFEKQAEE